MGNAVEVVVEDVEVICSVVSDPVNSAVVSKTHKILSFEVKINQDSNLPDVGSVATKRKSFMIGKEYLH